MQLRFNLRFFEIFSLSLLFTFLSLLGHNSRAEEITKEHLDSLTENARALIRDNNNDSTLILTNYVIEKSTAIGYELGIARGLVVQASYYINQTKLDTSAVLFNRAEEIYLANNFFGDTLQSKYHTLLLTKGAWNIYKRNFDEAEKQIKTASRLYLEEGDSTRHFQTLNSLGRIHGMKGSFAQALDYFLKAYDGFGKAESINASVTLGNIALCYKYLGHVEKAAEYLKSGIAMDVKNGWRSQMNKYNGLATIYSMKDDLDSAIYFDEKAFEASQKFGGYNTAIISISNMAQYYALKKELGKADSLMKIALKIADSVGIKSVEEQFDIIKAELTYDRKVYDSTLYYSRRALSSTTRFSHRRYSSVTSKLLSKTFEKLGQIDSAIYYLKQHHAYEDSLFNKNNQRKVTELYTKMETLEKDREIELLQKEKELQQLKKQRLRVVITGAAIAIILLIMALVYRHKNRIKSEEVKQVKLRSELEKGQADLYKQTLNMIHMNNCMDNLELQIKDSMVKNGDSDYRKILHTIRMNKTLKKDWENFNNYFSNSHSEFYEKLSGLSDKLSNHEKRVCALIKLNLSNREIATILNIEKRSAVMIKYRIKKKIGLEESNDLNKYVQEI